MTARFTERVESAWQDALRAEHQAVFAYPLIGTRLTDDERELAAAFALAHERRRDEIVAAMAAAGLTPAAAQSDYPGLQPVRDATAARRVAVRVEDACASAWRHLYARTASGQQTAAVRELRATSQQRLTDAAVGALRWRFRIDPARATTPFPGL